jgi:hypothetical protein
MRYPLSTLAAATLLAVASASAQQAPQAPPPAPRAGAAEERLGWDQASQLVGRLQQQGYTDIREVKIKRGHVEVEARNQRGEKVEVRIGADGRMREQRDD